jgi:choline dehydrogenase-like flavoprotein
MRSDGWDTIVVGSGAGGATVARELSRFDKKVLMLESGRHHKWIGNTIAASQYTDKMGLRRSREGLIILRALTTGGSTLIYGACATRPPAWLLHEYGIDLQDEVRKTEAELHISPTPGHLIGSGVRRIMEAANRLGFGWQVFPKFVDYRKCAPDCWSCMLGCRRGAKWTARNYVEEAKKNGCSLQTQCTVESIITKNGKAVGVRGTKSNKVFQVFGKTIVVAAGGLGTPVILRRSGIKGAGEKFFCDPMTMVYGTIRGSGNGYDIPNTAGSLKFHDTEGIFLADFVDPRFVFPMQMLLTGVKYLPRWLEYGHMLGILVKIKDTPGGRIYSNGAFSKPMNQEDLDKMERGISLATQVLVEAGVRKASIMHTRIRGAHPGGSAAIDQVVDRKLETSQKCLFVCDASVLPKSMASPQVLTITSLAKRLARHLRHKLA